MEKYEQPGVKINSKPPSQEYKDNYEAIFGKKETWLERRERLYREYKESEMNKDSCYGPPPPCDQDDDDNSGFGWG